MERASAHVWKVRLCYIGLCRNGARAARTIAEPSHFKGRLRKPSSCIARPSAAGDFEPVKTKGRRVVAPPATASKVLTAANRNKDLGVSALAQQRDVALRLFDRIAKVIHAGDGGAVRRHDDVAGLQTGSERWAGSFFNQHAVLGVGLLLLLA